MFTAPHNLMLIIFYYLFFILVYSNDCTFLCVSKGVYNTRHIRLSVVLIFIYSATFIKYLLDTYMSSTITTGMGVHQINTNFNFIELTFQNFYFYM